MHDAYSRDHLIWAILIHSIRSQRTLTLRILYLRDNDGDLFLLCHHRHRHHRRRPLAEFSCRHESDRILAISRFPTRNTRLGINRSSFNGGELYRGLREKIYKSWENSQFYPQTQQDIRKVSLNVGRSEGKLSMGKLFRSRLPALSGFPLCARMRIIVPLDLLLLLLLLPLFAIAWLVEKY